MVPKSAPGRQTEERLGTGPGLTHQLFSTRETRSQWVLVVCSTVFSSEWSGLCSLLPRAWLGTQAVPLVVAWGVGCAPARSKGASLLPPGPVTRCCLWVFLGRQPRPITSPCFSHGFNRSQKDVRVEFRSAASWPLLGFQNLWDLRLHVVLQHLPGPAQQQAVFVWLPRQRPGWWPHCDPSHWAPGRRDVKAGGSPAPPAASAASGAGAPARALQAHGAPRCSRGLGRARRGGVRTPAQGDPSPGRPHRSVQPPRPAGSPHGGSAAVATPGAGGP